MIAFVAGVIAASTEVGSRQEKRSQSTTIGVAPTCFTAAAVAIKVWVDIITSSPGEIPEAYK